MDSFLADLPTFIVLARTGSMSKSAKELGVPRSTVSRRLQRLEQEIGVPLVERTTRSLRLTQSGKMLAEGSASLLAQMKTLKEQVIESATKLDGLIRVSTPPGLGGPFIGIFLGILRSRIPGLRVEYVVREDLPHLIDEGFDLVLRTGPLPDSPWVRKKLGNSRYLCVANSNYLKISGMPESIEDLQQKNLLSIRTDDLNPHSWPLQSGGNFRVNPVMISNDMSSIVNAALHGIGIALLPLHLIFQDLLSGRLKSVLKDEVGRSLDVYALYAAERKNSPILRKVLEQIDHFGTQIQGSIAKSFVF